MARQTAATIPANVVDLVRALALKERRSLSAMLAILVEEALRARGMLS